MRKISQSGDGKLLKLALSRRFSHDDARLRDCSARPRGMAASSSTAGACDALAALPPAAQLRTWLYGVQAGAGSVRRVEAAGRWAALDVLARSPADLAPELDRLAALIERSGTTTRSNVDTARLRRRAAIALLRLCDPPPESGRLQVALARGFALALPRRLGSPWVVPALMSPAECAGLIAEATAYGASNGWGSLHRKYATTDMVTDLLPSGPRVRELMRDRALPLFARRFGRRYGPPSDLEFKSLFVARYEAPHDAQQPRCAPAGRVGAEPGLGGHVDESMLSLVLQLSADGAFVGGGTTFEVGGGARGAEPQLVLPGCGGAVLFLGRVYHAAAPITAGTRHVLVALIERRAAPEVLVR